MPVTPDELSGVAELVQSAIRGDPEAALLWVSKGQRHLARALSERGFTASQKLVGRLLRGLGFSLQANRKTREGPSHPDRNAQINAFQAAGQPTISVDTKKKELVGDFKNGGRELRPKGDPEPVRAHDFMLPELGKVAPYGVYDIAANAGWTNLGITSDTAAFAVESIRRWWRELGQARYQNAKRILITADCGGSNGARARLWKTELQTLADQTGSAITVAHLPPGTRKWNRIEHCLLAFITQNWRGKPSVSCSNRHHALVPRAWWRLLHDTESVSGPKRLAVMQAEPRVSRRECGTAPRRGSDRTGVRSPSGRSLHRPSRARWRAASRRRRRRRRGCGR